MVKVASGTEEEGRDERGRLEVEKRSHGRAERVTCRSGDNGLVGRQRLLAEEDDPEHERHGSRDQVATCARDAP